MYTDPGHAVLDPMVGAGTTLVEAKLLNRHCLGIDINPAAVALAQQALNFDPHTAAENPVIPSPGAPGRNLQKSTVPSRCPERVEGTPHSTTIQNRVSSIENPESSIEHQVSRFENPASSHASACRQKADVGDARDLSRLKDESFDLIITHPPYMNIIKYSAGRIPEDLSNIGSLPRFCGDIEKVASECFRVLKPDRHCAILIGDTRRGRHFVPLAFNVMQRFLKAGFALKEDIIKIQHNRTTTRRWTAAAKRKGFYLIMHEHLFVFRKPTAHEDLSRIKYSTGKY
jgi:DNA modification methylase